MFNIGPLELGVLLLVAVVVVGPDKLPALARDAANMLKTLRDLATGARKQLRDELGPEFADMDLRNLNPRTAVQRAVFGDDVDLGRLNPRNALRDAIFGDEDIKAADPRAVVRDARDSVRSSFSFGDSDDDEAVSTAKPSMTKSQAEPTMTKPTMTKPTSRPRESVARPRPKPGPATPYDNDAT